jgi:hypothetical protein
MKWSGGSNVTLGGAVRHDGAGLGQIRSHGKRTGRGTSDAQGRCKTLRSGQIRGSGDQ